MYRYDIVVIGGGPGGYAAAIRGAQLGNNVAIVEAGHLGGDCLNSGCIPSKTLHAYTNFIHKIEKAKSWGIETGPVELSFKKMMENKDYVIQKQRLSAARMLFKERIAFYNGYAKVVGKNEILVQSNMGKMLVKGEKVIVATGGKPLIPSIPGIDQVDILTYDTIFNLAEIPKSLVIIGDGIIAAEFAGIFASLNTKVTIVGTGDRMVPEVDIDASNLLESVLLKKKVRIYKNKKIASMHQKEGLKSIIIESIDGLTREIDCEHILVAAGRAPELSALEDQPVHMNGQFVNVNEYMETNINGIYAVGDIVGGWQLAHKAAAEGKAAVEHASGHFPQIDHKLIPRCIYTSPELATVGISEEEADIKGIPCRIQKYPLSCNGKAGVLGGGFIKIIADEQNSEILGVVIAGVNATCIIPAFSALISMGGTMAELAKMIQTQPFIPKPLFGAANLWELQGGHQS